MADGNQHPMENGREKHDDASSLSSTEAQAGVKGIEAISSTWTRSSLTIAYIG